MKATNKPLITSIILCCTSWFGSFASANTGAIDPAHIVKATSNEVQNLLMTEDGSNTESIRQQVDMILMPRFDFERMTALAVGKNWRTASVEQKNNLTQEFKGLLTHTYFSTMLRYRDVAIVINPEAIFTHEGKRATVKTDVYLDNNPEGGQSISIDYSVYQTDAGWKVYNVSVEGASLVTVYRNQFNEQVSRSGIDGLIDVLKNKNSRNALPADQSQETPTTETAQATANP